MSYQEKLKPIASTTSTGGYASKLKPIASAPAPEEKDGFLKSILKDAAETLVVKPIDRATEAATRVFAPNSMAAKGYEAAYDEGRNRNVLGMEIEQQRGLKDGGLKQIAGEALKGASYLYTGGAGAPAVGAAVKSFVPGASRTLFSQAVRNSAVQGAKTGAIGGGAYGAGEEMTKEDSTLESIAGAGAVGAGLGAVTGGALGTAVPYATKLFSPAERAAKKSQEISDAMRRSIPITAKSNPKRDSEITARVLRDLDIDGAETNADFIKKADERIEAIKKAKQEVLTTNPVTRKLSEFGTKVGEQKVPVNHVEDALTQLEKQYEKTNNVQGVATVRQIREKANTTGLTAKEVDDIAVMSGRDLNAFNPLSNELASGVNKIAVENTRKGVKQASRDLFGDVDKNLKEADAAISDLIRFKTIRENRAKAVEAFNAARLDPTFRQKIQGLISQVVDIATLGSAKGLVSLALKGSANTVKKMNPVEMEALLAKDLRLIQEASKKGASEAEIISKLRQFIENNGQKPVLLLEAPKLAPLFATKGGKITPVAQEASDIAAVESGAAKIPKTGPYYKQKVKEIQDRIEPYLTESEMKIIRMGNKNDRPKSNLPVAEGLPNVYTPPSKLRNALQNKLERYLTPDEMEIIDFGPAPKKKKTLNETFIE